MLSTLYIFVLACVFGFSGKIPVALLRWKFAENRTVELKGNAGLVLPSSTGELGDSVTKIDLRNHDLRGGLSILVLSFSTFLSLVQANLKSRHFLAVVVIHVAIKIQWRAFWDLKALVLVEVKRRQVGQLRELFRDAAWHHPAAQNLKVNKKAAQNTSARYGC